MNKISELRTLGAMTLAMGIGLFAALACRAEPYLALVGPPPLRFEVITTNNPLFTAELALPKQQLPEGPELAFLGGKNAAANSAGAGAAENAPRMTGDGAKNSGNGADAASELLNVNPQMVTQYLKPEQSEFPAEPSPFQRGQSIMVPAELGFVPPLPGSRAIYISK